MFEIFENKKNKKFINVIVFEIKYVGKIDIKWNCFCVDKLIVEIFFKICLDSIVNYIRMFLGKFEVVGIKYMVFVGGFVELEYIREELLKVFG